MARLGVTIEDVANAIRDIESQGDRVTYLAVRRALGDTGSMSTIRAHIEAVRAQQSSPPREAREVPPDLASDLAQSATRFWDRAQEAARRDIEVIRAASQARAESLQKELDDLCVAFDAQSETLSQKEADLDRLRGRLHEVEEAFVAKQAEKAELEKAYAALMMRFDAHADAIGRLTSKTQSRGTRRRGKANQA